MLKDAVVSGLALLVGLSATPLFAEEIAKSSIPIEERAFVDAIDGFTKAQIVAHFGEPSKADDVKIKGTNRVVASIWQYHNINKAQDGSFYPTTELDFIDDKVVQVVFLNHDGTEIEAPDADSTSPPLQQDMPM